MAHVTDYDVWHVDEEPVTVDMVIQTLRRNVTLAQEAIRNLVKRLPAEKTCTCEHALADALITDPAMVPPQTRQKLQLLVEKYLP